METQPIEALDPIAKKNDLHGRVIVITGASSGFGKGAAIEFAKRGARLVLAARRIGLLTELAEALSPEAGNVLPVQADVSDPSEVGNLCSRTLAQFGRFDVWINNAGVGAVGRFEDIPLQDHTQVIGTNLLGTIYGSYYAMDQFRRQGYGILINVSSVLGVIPMPYYSSYVASKHGVQGLSAALRRELLENKIDTIRVCTVMPTSTDTPFFEHAANYTGHEFKPTPPVYDPEETISAIVNLALNPQDEVAPGAAAKGAALAHRIAPAMTESYMSGETHETLMEKAPRAEETSGSVHAPVDHVEGIRGTGPETRQ